MSEGEGGCGGRGVPFASAASRRRAITRDREVYFRPRVLIEQISRAFVYEGFRSPPGPRG